jgi:integrase/recombinase XerD
VARLRIPETLTPDECTALLSAFNLRYWAPRRNHALVSVMLASGLRCAEALALEWAPHIDLMSGRVWVENGKGGRDRIVWLPPHVLDVLGAWRTSNAHNLVFPTGAGARMLTCYVRAAIPRAARRAGIDKRVHPHLLRHTFATELYRRTRDIRIVQRALGHSSIAHTQIYTHVSDNEVRDAMRGA